MSTCFKATGLKISGTTVGKSVELLATGLPEEEGLLRRGGSLASEWYCERTNVVDVVWISLRVG
jgi:hypothetical protein